MTIIERECRYCKESKPLTSEFFQPHSGGKGFRKVCRTCQAALKKGELHPEERSRQGANGPERRCTKCGQWKPETRDFFSKQAKGRGGLESACKACKRARRQELYDEQPAVAESKAKRQEKRRAKAALRRQCQSCGAEHITWEGHYYTAESQECITCEQAKAAAYWEAKYGDRRVIDPSEPLKKCSRCGVVYPRSSDHFSRSAPKYDGLNPHCKACAKKMRRSWYEENVESERAKSRAQWRSLTPEQRVTRRVKRRAGERGKSLDPYATAARNHNARARRLGVPGRVTAAELRDLREVRQGNCCAYCERELTEIRRPQADHILPITREGATGDISNFAWACGRCNQFKNDRTLEEWKVRWYDSPELLLAEAELERLTGIEQLSPYEIDPEI